MLFDVSPLRRQGVLVPAWQRGHYFVRGELRVNEAFDSELNRRVRIATIEPVEPATIDLKPLHDVVLVAATRDLWTLTGYEVESSLTSDRAVHYRQSWLLVPAHVRDTEREHGDRYRASLAAEKSGLVVADTPLSPGIANSGV